MAGATSVLKGKSMRDNDVEVFLLTDQTAYATNDFNVRYRAI